MPNEKTATLARFNDAHRSIGCRARELVNDEHVNRFHATLQFQAKLLFQGHKNGRQIRRRSSRRRLGILLLL
jgi:hypothetical protein